MHLRLILVSLAFSLACVHAQDSSPAAYGFRDTPEKSFLSKASYRLTFLRAEVDKNHGAMGLFQLRHSDAGPIKLWGFGFEKDGSFRVRFERFAKQVAGQWQETPVGYCGTGAQTYEIAPERDYVLRVPLWPYLKEPARGVVLLEGDPARLLSEEFDVETVRAVGRSKSRAK